MKIIEFVAQFPPIQCLQPWPLAPQGTFEAGGTQDLSGFGVSKDELQVFFKRYSDNFRPVEICTALFHTFPLYFCSADAGSPS